MSIFDLLVFRFILYILYKNLCMYQGLIKLELIHWINIDKITECQVCVQ